MKGDGSTQSSYGVAWLPGSIVAEGSLLCGADESLALAVLITGGRRFFEGDPPGEAVLTLPGELSSSAKWRSPMWTCPLAMGVPPLGEICHREESSERAVSPPSFTAAVDIAVELQDLRTGAEAGILRRGTWVACRRGGDQLQGGSL